MSKPLFDVHFNADPKAKRDANKDVVRSKCVANFITYVAKGHEKLADLQIKYQAELGKCENMCINTARELRSQIADTQKAVDETKVFYREYLGKDFPSDL